MLSDQPTVVVSAFGRLQKLTRRINCMHQNGTYDAIPFQQKTSLFKKYKRYLKKIVAVEHPVAKAISLCALALLLSSEGHTQCKRFISADEANPLQPQNLSFKFIKPVFVDIDGDGDLDCYGDNPAEEYYLSQFVFFRNVGSATAPAFELEGSGGLPAITNFYSGEVDGPTFCDLDGDGDFDCFVGNYRRVVYFENTGDAANPVFVQRPDAENPLNFFSGYYGLYFNLVDFDSDGDFDLFTDDLYFAGVYENTGTPTNPDFVLYRGEDYGLFNFNPHYGHGIFFDWTKDGLTDAIIADGSYYVYYRNDGTATKPHYIRENRGEPEFPDNFRIHTIVDLNNDGYMEAFSYDARYAVNAPVAAVIAKPQDTFTRLDAWPKGPFVYGWSKDGIPLHETADFIRVTEPGSYTVTITGNCGSNISLPYVINNTAAPGVSAQNSAVVTNQYIRLKLYPNPFTDECLLQFDQNLQGNTTVQVTDVLGRLVLAQHATGNSIRTGKTLAPGMYFVQVIQNNKIVFRQKIIKQ